jgi:adenylosuccinate lyase
LAAAGMLREDAYRLVQGYAMRAWETDGDFRVSVEKDPKIQSYLKPEKITESFSIVRQLANVDRIFDRVFQES